MKYVFSFLIYILASFFWLAHPAEAQEQALRNDNSSIFTWTGENDYAFLGIYSEQISREKARKLGFENPYGSYVSRVVKHSAAERAGMQPFDYIFGVDEYRTGEGQGLTQIIRRYAPGQKAAIHFIRQSRKRTETVTFGKRPGEERPERTECQRPFFGVSPQNLEKAPADGVPITTISNSTAEAMGLLDGDVIESINGHRIVDWRDIAIAIEAMEVGQTIVVEYRRNGRKEKGSQPIKSHCETKAESKWEVPVTPEPGDWFNRHFNNPEEKNGAGNAQALSIQVESLNKEEAQRLNQEKNMGISTANNLPLQGLSVSVQTGALVRIKCWLPESGNTTVKIFNDSGRMVYNYELGNFTGQFDDEVDLLKNGNGAYYLEIKQGKRSISKKIRVSGR